MFQNINKILFKFKSFKNFDFSVLKFSSWSDNHCQVEDISLSSLFATFDLNPKLLIWCVGQFKIISRDIEIKKEYASGNHALLIGDEAKNDYENEIFKRYFLWPSTDLSGPNVVKHMSEGFRGHPCVWATEYTSVNLMSRKMWRLVISGNAQINSY